MITITKKYHFHAAHRNELLDDKCSNIHGHTYHLEIEFIVTKLGKGGTGVTMLFSDIDRHVEMLVNMLDHCFIIHTKDPLMPFLLGKTRLYTLSVPTSCENLAEHILETFAGNSHLPPIKKISLQETTSSVVTIHVNQTTT